MHSRSWDTMVKHYYRMGLENNIPQHIQDAVPRTNIHRWKSESVEKYAGNELIDFIQKDIELYKKIGQTNRLKRLNENYFKLISVLHEILNGISGYKKLIREHSSKIINCIENLDPNMDIKNCLKVFNISISSYYHLKSLHLHKCSDSYFQWCRKKWPNQPIKIEIFRMKALLLEEKYRSWSKSSIYFVAKRQKAVSFGLSTWYRYCKLLGFKRPECWKIKSYTSLKSTRPNEIWCADVTIFKTLNGSKHYIHFLMDHYSRLILGYKIEAYSSANAISQLISSAVEKFRPKSLIFLTDGGTENINSCVSKTIDSANCIIRHLVAQKDILFSNSMIEALNKVMKYQFLYPRVINTKEQLIFDLAKSVLTYNNERPQLALGGKTPYECFNNLKIEFAEEIFLYNSKQENLGFSCKVCD